MTDQSKEAHDFLSREVLLNCNAIINDILENFKNQWDYSENPWFEDLFLQYHEPEEDCDEQEIREPYEFYAVSDRFAHMLQEHNQLLTNHWGFWIWGREATGQSIILDHVFQKVWSEYKNS